MRRLLLVLFMLSSITAVAAEQDDELQRLQIALSMLNQEQLSVYQQFQMVQELRRSNVQPSYGTLMLPVPGGEIANYDDVIAAQNSVIRRNEELAREAHRLVTRYGEIEEAKKPLQQQILSLMGGNK